MSFLDLLDEDNVEGAQGDVLGNLEQEVAMLKRMMSSTNPFSPLTSTPAPVTPMESKGSVGSVKPKDIPRLELEQLHGVEASARLQMFFELVEQCAGDSASRIQVAKSRVSTEIAILIHNKRAEIYLWSDLKEFLVSEFASEISFDTAWKELDAMRYDWGESPQAFVHKFICRHAAIVSRFPGFKFPDRDRQLKRRLWKGMPKSSRERLKSFWTNPSHSDYLWNV